MCKYSMSMQLQVCVLVFAFLTETENSSFTSTKLSIFPSHPWLLLSFTRYQRMSKFAKIKSIIAHADSEVLGTKIIHTSTSLYSIR